LQKQLDALVAGSDSVGVEQLRAAAREQRLVSEATQELRAKLAVMRAHSAALDNGQLRLA
jgi:hypothetical protein